MDKRKILRGGLWDWRDIIYAAMRLQSHNALGQAGLLIGADKIIRADAPTSEEKIHMDNSTRAVSDLPSAATASLDELGDRVASEFLADMAAPYEPIQT